MSSVTKKTIRLDMRTSGYLTSNTMMAQVIDDNDPENLDRVKIRIPAYHGPFKGKASKLTVKDEDLPWAKVTTLKTPAKDGYVYVTFDNSNPNYPVVVALDKASNSFSLDALLGGGAEGGIEGGIGGIGDEIIYGASTTGGAAVTGANRNYYWVVKGAKPYNCRWPLEVAGNISSLYGPRNVGSSPHRGIDITGSSHKILAIHAGTVTFAGNGSGYGAHVCIYHKDIGITSLYGHMVYGSLKVKNGQKVVQGQLLGTMDNTGSSYGTHLHISINKGNTRYPTSTSYNPAQILDVPRKTTINGPWRSAIVKTSKYTKK